MEWINAKLLYLFFLRQGNFPCSPQWAWRNVFRGKKLNKTFSPYLCTMSEHLVCEKRIWSIRDLFITSPFFLICLCFRNDSLLKCKVLIFKRYDYYLFLCLPEVCNHTKWRNSFPKERADTEISGKLCDTLFWILKIINLIWVLKWFLLLTAWPLATPFVSIAACSENKRIQTLHIIFPIETVKYH